MLKRSLIVAILLTFLASLATTAPAVAKEHKVRSKSAYLGVYLQDITTSIKEAMDLKSKGGVLVREVVEDSPADKAGIQQEDVIIEFDGKKVKDSSHLTRLIRKSSPDEEGKLKIIRDGKEKTIIVVLGKRPKDLLSYDFEETLFLEKPKGFKPHTYSFRVFSGNRIGVKVQDLTEQLGHYFGVEDGEGALITEVEEDMPAFQAGLKAGDVIVEVDGEDIEDTEDLIDVISEKEEGDKVKIRVIRDHKSKTFEVEVEEEKGWSSFDFSDLDKLKIYTEKFQAPEIFLEKELSSEFEEELEELREELKELKEELEELRRKIR